MIGICRYQLYLFRLFLGYMGDEIIIVDAASVSGMKKYLPAVLKGSDRTGRAHVPERGVL